MIDYSGARTLEALSDFIEGKIAKEEVLGILHTNVNSISHLTFKIYIHLSLTLALAFFAWLPVILCNSVLNIFV